MINTHNQHSKNKTTNFCAMKTPLEQAKQAHDPSNLHITLSSPSTELSKAIP
jgi:hypothetical protein